ncbi:MAG TPA: amidase [Rhodocyclaceae bacterium]|nr:amidase [Rhodocyclaceae bacterium]
MTSTTPSDLFHLSAVETLKLFRERQLSPVELLNGYLERAERLSPALNPFSAMRAEEALAQARAAERTYMKAADTARELEGLPTVLKNEHNLIGLHTTQGSWLCGDEPDTHNAPLVQRLLDAGAVIHGQTNVPEFYLAAFTRSNRYGVTRNPWNPAITCGGSSGGSAVALASGMTTLATASDIGGSIRVPSSYCGVVGLKPSYGRIPESSFSFAMNPCNHNGVMARSVADCALMFNVVAGPHAVDPSVVPMQSLPLEYGSVKGLRIAVSYDLGYIQIADDVRRNTQRVVAALREAGAVVEEVVIPWQRATVVDTFTNYLGFLLGRPLIEAVEHHRDQISDFIIAFTEIAKGITPEMYFAASENIGVLHASLQQSVFAQYDALICPTMADTSTPAEGMAQSHDNLMTKGFTYPFNLLSRHPVLAVPSGIADNGVPTGVQLVGQTFDEETVMRIGANLERLMPWTYPVL